MNPGTLNERMVPGYDWVREYPWTAGGELVAVTDATFHVLDDATGNAVVDWSVTSGHIVINDKIPRLTVPLAETVALATRKLRLRYLLDIDDGSGPQPFVEGSLLVK